ncbi:O-linked N-acetylglucosamine transferase family protein [Cupriavidus sp. RAF12]|uniref:O-linked N-acetylglucosamine transferase, SPINDLY family protein n=1 Tax=Cupriavidus sp. RAF12 TaxID=3233050 RepID=UPI003F8E12A2
MRTNLSAEPAQRATAKAWASYKARNFQETLKFAERAEKLGTRLPDASFLRAVTFFSLGSLEEAKRLAEAGHERFPNHAGFTALVGAVEVQIGTDLPRAAEFLQRSLDLDPNVGSVWQNFAATLFNMGDFAGSRKAGARALEFSPNDSTTLGNYASALRESGDAVKAIPYFRKACSLDPTHKINRSNTLLALLYDEHISAKDLLDEAKDWATVLGRTVSKTAPVFEPKPGRIRIGVLSNDLYRHACAYFLLPLIANIDRTHFEVALFGLNPRTDAVTSKIMQYAETFSDLSKLKEDEVIQHIRDAGIDVLIDLGGYTGLSPLQFMAHRLAPVQFTWLGYPGTTGMPTIDYRITDAVGDPVGFESHYTEKLLRAPVFGVYHALVSNPLHIYSQRYRVRQTPALKNGFITFGSCNSIAKLTPKAMRLWSAVMARCPNSKLLIEAYGVDMDDVRGPLQIRLEAAGIDCERVTFVPRIGANQYVTYHDIDIVLDTAPVTGGTTTCDAIWMGVPVVTLAGDTFHQRVSAPFLHTAGLDDLICSTEEEYVNVACELAQDPTALDALRATLRQRMEQSPASDAAGFAAWFEEQVFEVVKDRKPVERVGARRQQGIYFNGKWYPVQDLVLSVAAHLQLGEIEPLRNVLENLTTTWHRHWMVAYGLAEIEYRTGDKNEAIELLVESIGLRPYSLPLYRILAGWLQENNLDSTALEALLGEQFGLDIATLTSSPMPSVFEVMGIEVVNVPAEEVAA